MLIHNTNSSVTNSFPAFPKSRIPNHLKLVPPYDLPSSRSIRHILLLPLTWINNNLTLQGSSIELTPDDDDEEEDEDGPCPVDCVREFKTEDEFDSFLQKAKQNESLVVVDFYRRSCGSCKYIEQGFAKLCKGSGDEQASVIFLKHDVMDEFDEQSEVAERLKIKTVPLFHFYKNGALLEAFPTRDKERITSAIIKYSSPSC